MLYGATTFVFKKKWAILSWIIIKITSYCIRMLTQVILLHLVAGCDHTPFMMQGVSKGMQSLLACIPGQWKAASCCIPVMIRSVLLHSCDDAWCAALQSWRMERRMDTIPGEWKEGCGCIPVHILYGNRNAITPPQQDTIKISESTSQHYLDLWLSCCHSVSSLGQNSQKPKSLRTILLP